jgi:hypothetical protein
MPGGRAQVLEERGVDLPVEHVHARSVGRAGQDAERGAVGLEGIDCSVCIRLEYRQNSLQNLRSVVAAGAEHDCHVGEI